MAGIPVKGADNATYQIAALSLGLTPASSALSVILSGDGGHAKSTDITALSTAITGALAQTQTVSVTGTAAVTQSGTWNVGLAAGATVALAGGNTVALKVDGSAVIQPISATALPLPSGAATETKLETVRALLAGTLSATIGNFPASQAVTGTVSVSNFPATQAVTGVLTDTQLRANPIPVSNASLPLPAGAATEAGLGTDGATPPTIAGTGVRGWLRGVYEKLSGILSVDTVVRSPATDRGGTITAGGTAQQLMAANTSRRGLVVQNQSTDALYINGLTTAAIGPSSLKIGPGQIYESPAHHVGTGAISIIGPTTGQAIYAREF